MSKKLTEKLREAYGRFNTRDIAGAERLCREVLGRSPDNAEALHLLGLAQLVAGKAKEAVALIAKAVERNPLDPSALENLGVANLAAGQAAAAESAFRQALALGSSHASLHMRLGLALTAQRKLAEAVAALSTAASKAPDDPDVQLNLGIALGEHGQSEEALACFRNVVALRPNYVDAHYNLGTLLKRIGRHEEALAAYEAALALAPDYADAHNNLGTVHEEMGRIDEAIECYRRALAHDANQVHAHSNLGNALRVQGRLEEAAACCEKALAIRPDFTDALINLGNVRVEQGRPGEAQALYEKAARIDSRSGDARRNLGALFRTQGRLREAMASYRQALEVDPDRAATYEGLGSALRDGGDFEGAVAAFEKAMSLDPQSAHAHHELAETLKVPGRFEEAIAAYERTLALKPDYYQALAGLIYLRQHLCDWNGIETLWERLRTEAIGRPESGVSPFSMLTMPYTAQEQLACAREWARHRLARLIAARPELGFTIAPRAPHARLRVGYLSWDFHRHATSYLMAELFELHDRGRFEVFTYSYGPDDGSPIRARIRSACEHFAGVSGESFVETAQRIVRDEIDVLVDLKGYTLASRPQIIALRPAPVQVNWLGYPGTMGTDCVDYIIADPFIIPAGAERHYSEKVVRLPDCYQVNDRKREISSRTLTREECGLPAAALVFCCFNQAAKILPDVFAAWMRIMRAVPDSVLWLLETHSKAAENLRRAAAERGVAPERLVFAPRKPVEEHLARYRVADLSIDTFPYTSHTTASDALWAGCPLVTCAGETFASRVAGSVLSNAGLPELVTDSLAQYERLILELATHRERLAGIRRKVRENRDSCALFDTPRFVKHLERAYEEMFNGWNKAAAAGVDAVESGQ